MRLNSGTSLNEVRSLMEGYPAAYRPVQCDSLRSAGGFSGAQIWRIATEVGPFCLRGADAAGVDLTRQRGLHRLLAHVHNSGVPQVSVPVRRSDGLTLTVRRGWVWQLEPWMPGAADFCNRPVRERLEAAMACLAQWHRAAAGFEPLASERPWFYRAPQAHSPGIEERLRLAAECNEETCDRLRTLAQAYCTRDIAQLAHEILRLFRQCAPAVLDRLRVASMMCVPLQSCLRDIWHDHVLFSGNLVTGLIDANACRTDCVATDLARLLGSLVGDDAQARDAGLAAYEMHRPLTLEERALVDVFDQSAVLLSGLTWLEWLCVDRRAFDDASRVSTRLEEISDRLAHLARSGC